MDNTWELLKQFYKTNLGIEGKVVEYLAVVDILKLCAEGHSNLKIALMSDFEEEYVKCVIQEYFKFDGWSTDFDFNTRALYERCKYNKYTFISLARERDKTTSESSFGWVYRINQKLDDIEKEIEKGYK